MSQDNAPDLNSILRTLSAFSNQNHAIEADNSYEPPPVQPLPVPQAQPQYPRQPPSSSPPSSQAQAQSQSQNREPSSSITTWPAALRQVMRTVAQNEDIQRRIRFLIQRQHDHERQWWKGREALVQKQSARKEKKRELDQVLRSIGAPVEEKDVSTAEEDIAEVHSYDIKVYRASKQMADAMLVELKALEVPFFCISKGLIASDANKQNHQHGPDTPDRQSRLSVDELTAFQQRMLELLQDLCKE
ncbi:uncharacterized protein DSM5745_00584 [Aspergillus mulundensis]|uniref:Uncharacterized protein n=1 Tax=Aspergillus mulundensis TaxID=1810919 RepID=A0A3D8T3X3_9EURO|nr:Uncharacterized protein DSM5745_00584 [Aspergillus mulundensis]RDW93262.1 Uncharacterized protein DSM5745_00584 [Aspergillus mulundensis]